MKKLCKKVAAFSVAMTVAATLAGGIGTLSLGASAAVEEILPIAKYEFKDAQNFGKDSMGNYDMSYRNAWAPGGTGPLYNGATANAEGGIDFNGNTCLSQELNNDILEDVTAFTLAFELKHPAEGDWNGILGTDFANCANAFQVWGTGDVRLSVKNTSLDGDWAGVILFSDNDNFHKVIISVQPGGQLNAWVDGALVTAENKLPISPLSEDFTLHSPNGAFAIGSRYNGNATYPSTASIKNVTFYDFAMDEAAATAYNTNGKLTASDCAGLTTITGATATFAEEPTKSVLNLSMTEEEMLAEMNEATATLTLSNEGTATAPIVWKQVVKEGQNYFAVGTFDATKLGYANVYGNEVRYQLSVATVESIGDPVFPNGQIAKSELKDSMTAEEMLAALNTATVEISFGGDNKQSVEVTFTRIEMNMGEYVAYGDIIVGGSAVGTAKVKLSVTVTNEGPTKELLPIAKWEFEDESNPGKDSMGKYQLTPAAREGGNRGGDPFGGGRVEEGKLYLDGDSVLACTDLNDVSDVIDNGFTLNFQVQMDPGIWELIAREQDADDWAVPVGFGREDWAAKQGLHFLSPRNGNNLLIGSAYGITKNDKGNADYYWGPGVVGDITDKLHNITLTVRPGEMFDVYADGVRVLQESCPKNWSLKNTAGMNFALGGDVMYNNGYSRFAGWLDNVSIYNFAVGEAQVAAFWQKGKLTVGDMEGEIVTSIENAPHFVDAEGNPTESYLKNEEQKLSDKITATQAIRRVNAATVNAVFENEETLSLPITWLRLEQDGEKWYMIGEVDPGNIGYASTLTDKQTIKYEVTVQRLTRQVTVSTAIKNGTLTADKTEAYLGDSVTFTATPAEGYVVDSVTVNGEKLTAGADGKFVYVVTGIEEVEASATFKQQAAEDPGKEPDKDPDKDPEKDPDKDKEEPDSGCGGIIAGNAALLGAVALAGVALVLFVRRKNA